LNKDPGPGPVEPKAQTGTENLLVLLSQRRHCDINRDLINRDLINRDLINRDLETA
jgi:hypothetical protein